MFRSEENETRQGVPIANCIDQFVPLLIYMYIHNKIGFWSLPVDLTYVTKLVEDCQKNLEYVKESVEDYRMMSTVLLEKAAPCNVLMYWAKHILQPPSPAPRHFPFSRAFYTIPKLHIFNIEVKKEP